jgi:hypothetical protein
VVEEAVAEPVAGLDQRVPRHGAADPVGGKSSLLLEGTGGGLGGRAELAADVLDREAEPAEALLHVADRFAG